MEQKYAGTDIWGISLDIKKEVKPAWIPHDRISFSINKTDSKEIFEFLKDAFFDVNSSTKPKVEYELKETSPNNFKIYRDYDGERGKKLEAEISVFKGSSIVSIYDTGTVTKIKKDDKFFSDTFDNMHLWYMNASRDEKEKIDTKNDFYRVGFETVLGPKGVNVYKTIFDKDGIIPNPKSEEDKEREEIHQKIMEKREKDRSTGTRISVISALALMGIGYVAVQYESAPKESIQIENDAIPRDTTGTDTTSIDTVVTE